MCCTKSPARNAPAMGPNPRVAASAPAVPPSTNTRMSRTRASAAPRKIRAVSARILFSSKLIADRRSDTRFASAVHAPRAPQATGANKGTHDASSDAQKISAEASEIDVAPFSPPSVPRTDLVHTSSISKTKANPKNAIPRTTGRRRLSNSLPSSVRGPRMVSRMLLPCTSCSANV